MGKKRIVKKSESGTASNSTSAFLRKRVKRRVSNGCAYITSTYNNTIITFTDDTGGVIFWASAGSLGFKGARKGTPYAASKVAELLAEKSKNIGLEEVRVYVNGIGAGRESAIRALSARGLAFTYIKDVTPIPFNGPKPPKVRRV